MKRSVTKWLSFLMVIALVFTSVNMTGWTTAMDVQAAEAETAFYSNVAVVTTDKLTLEEEDPNWSNKKEIAYDESISDTSITENFIMRLDVVLDEDAYQSLADEGDYFKLQSVVKVTDAWTWTQSNDIKTLTQSDFTAAGDTYKTEVKISFSDLDAATLRGIYFVVIGQGFEGKISFTNVSLTEVKNDVERTETLVFEGGDRTLSFNSVSDNGWAEKKYATNDSTVSDAGIIPVGDVTVGTKLKLTATVTLDGDASDLDGTETAENSGAYKAIQLAGVVKNTDDWVYQKADNYPFLKATDFTDGVTEVEFGFELENEGALNEIAFQYNSNGYDGNVIISNVKVYNVVEQEVTLPEKDPTMIDDFEEYEVGVSANWVDEGGWLYDNGVDLAVAEIGDGKALKVSLDYTGCAGESWSEAKTKKVFSEAIDVSAYNMLTFDVIYPEALDGSFKTKVFAQNYVSDTDKTTVIDKEGTMETSAFSDGMKKASVSIKFSPNKAPITDMTIGIVGVNTDFVGDVYLDNIKLAQYNPEADFVDITATVSDASIADISKMPSEVTLADKDATETTKALFAYLIGLDKADQVLFGHQNDTHKCVSTREGVYSDTKDITGSISGVVGIDSLALTGVELGLEDTDAAIAESIKIAKDAASEGAIITLSTHMPNMSNDKIVKNEDGTFDFSACDFEESKDLSNNCSEEVLPGGKYNAQFTAYLDIIAEFANGLGDEDIPVLFRPFHENTGGWFWWGSSTTDRETYNALFRYTKNYLTSKGVHNFIYVYSPGGPIASEAEYLDRYPGDDCVDVLGFDYYDDYSTYPAEYSDSFINNLKDTCEVVKNVADARGKVAVISEAGVRAMKADGSDYEGILVKDNPIKGHNWYKQVNDVAKETGMSYFLLWANFSDTNFYIPYKYNDTKGQELINEFIEFYNEDSSIFADGANFYGNASDVTVSGNEITTPYGYFTNVYSKSVIKEEKEIVAHVENAEVVTFVASNGDNEVTISANTVSANRVSSNSVSANSVATVYTGTLTDAMLAELGTTDIGKIKLVADGKTLDTRSYISFGKDKDVLAKNIVENFETYYGDNDYLNGTYSVNSAAGCSSSFSLDTKNKASGTYGGSFNYKLKTSKSEVWTGLKKSLSETDYSDYNALSLWVKPDGKAQKLVIQLVSDGEDFEAFLTNFTATTEAKYITIPFNKLVGKNGGTFDASKVTAFAVWCNTIPANGATDITSSIVFDDIEFVKVDTTTLKTENGYAVTDRPVTELGSSDPVPSGPSEQDALKITGIGTQLMFGKSAVLKTTGGSGNGAVTWSITSGKEYAEINAKTGEVLATGIGKVTVKATKAGDANFKEASATVTFETVMPNKNTTIEVKDAEYVVTSVKNKKETLAYAGTTDKSVTKVKVPDTVKVGTKTYKVTSIANDAFKGCTALKSVTIGKNVETIGNNAFANCTALKKVTIPANVKKIGKGAFSGDKNLKTISVKSKKITSVGKNAFKGINKKAKIKVPSSKLSKYQKLFKGKGQAKTVKITK